jgi:hypothetical protein
MDKELNGHWSTQGEFEIASKLVEKTRDELVHGELPDFELADQLFSADPYDIDSIIILQTAAQERIKWLSAMLFFIGGKENDS